MFVALGITIPVLPFVFTSDMGGGDHAVGLVFAATAVSGIVCRPALGRIGDSHGSERLLTLGVIVTSHGFAWD